MARGSWRSCLPSPRSPLPRSLGRRSPAQRTHLRAAPLYPSHLPSACSLLPLLPPPRSPPPSPLLTDASTGIAIPPSTAPARMSLIVMRSALVRAQVARRVYSAHGLAPRSDDDIAIQMIKVGAWGLALLELAPALWGIPVHMSADIMKWVVAQALTHAMALGGITCMVVAGRGSWAIYYRSPLVPPPLLGWAPRPLRLRDSAAIQEMTEATLSPLTCTVLRGMLRERGVSPSGRKQELITRLLAKFEEVSVQ
jgi:hypothetical protein